MHDIFERVPVEIISNDLCVSGRSTEEHDKNLALLLERARQENLIFNPKKVKLCINEVPFVGHILTPQGLKPDPQKIKAITNMPPPIDKTGIKRLTTLQSLFLIVQQ